MSSVKEAKNISKNSEQEFKIVLNDESQNLETISALID